MSCFVVVLDGRSMEENGFREISCSYQRGPPAAITVEVPQYIKTTIPCLSDHTGPHVSNWGNCYSADDIWHLMLVFSSQRYGLDTPSVRRIETGVSTNTGLEIQIETKHNQSILSILKSHGLLMCNTIWQQHYL